MVIAGIVPVAYTAVEKPLYQHSNMCREAPKNTGGNERGN